MRRGLPFASFKVAGCRLKVEGGEWQVSDFQLATFNLQTFKPANLQTYQENAMTSIREAFKRMFTPPPAPPSGTYHYQAPQDAELPYRLHLRIEPDGDGVLILNASTVMHLNPTATEYAYHLVKGTPDDDAARAVAARYRVRTSQARQDFRDLKERLLTLINTPDLDPVTYLDFDRFAPYSQPVSAPFRLDCAITYQLPDGINPEYAPTKRVDRELTTEEWKAILDKAWQAGIPHVVFTGGEPTLRDDLPELIRYAEHLGQVSGLLTDGRKLSAPNYLNEILQTGLDHIMLNLQPDNLTVAAALSNALSADIALVVHLTLTPENAARMSWVVDKLAESNIRAISLTATDSTLRTTLENIRDHASSLGMTLVWDLPVPYSTFNPVTVEVGEDAQPDGAGRAWLYVEPDGDVLPAQGINRVLGNFLSEPWETIWKAAGS
jgi:organic radical activating enzyme